MDRALFLFRRDLRLEDNTGLIFALKKARDVILAFVFTLDQIEHNAYRSDYCLQFMIESLEVLEEEIKKKGGKLFLFYGEPEEVIAQCKKQLSIDAVVVNKDYTPYSIKRDQNLEKICKQNAIAFYSFDDALLHAPEMTLKSDGRPYTVFTPYYRNASQLEVLEPKRCPTPSFYTKPIRFAKDSSLYHKILPKRNLQQGGGRKEALKILKHIKDYSQYKATRDFPAKDTTTHLSAHLKFTTVSPREVYHAIAREKVLGDDLLRSLYWRDFFTTIAYFSPHVFQGAFKPQYDKLKWSGDKKMFHKWCEGRTGVPIVDAGMRELNATGFMHNRVRMIVASFLVKDLHIDWRWGEKYFARMLIDYDPAVNNGNWQWVASTGCDAQPYFRIFNPWAQAAKFDPDAHYIKKWVLELKPLSAKEIHSCHLGLHRSKCPSYPLPIVDHAKEARIALSSYRRVR